MLLVKAMYAALGGRIDSAAFEKSRADYAHHKGDCLMMSTKPAVHAGRAGVSARKHRNQLDRKELRQSSGVISVKKDAGHAGIVDDDIEKVRLRYDVCTMPSVADVELTAVAQTVRPNPPLEIRDRRSDTWPRQRQTEPRSPPQTRPCAHARDERTAAVSSPNLGRMQRPAPASVP